MSFVGDQQSFKKNVTSQHPSYRRFQFDVECVNFKPIPKEKPLSMLFYGVVVDQER